MTVYQLLPPLDNPLFDGLVFEGPKELMRLIYHGCSGEEYRKNPSGWEVVRLKDRWPNPPPQATGLVRAFNDYPCIDLSIPAFSKRAVDYLRDLLEPNGELLPVQHAIGVYYVYNCTTLCDCVDLAKSVYTTFDSGSIRDIKRYVFIESLVKDLVFFRVRVSPKMLLCTDVVRERVERHRLNGFVFVPLWSTERQCDEYLVERRRAQAAAEKWRPAEGPPLEVKGNTVVVRLYTARKKPSKKELDLVNRIMDEIEARIYTPEQTEADYYGNIEGHDIVDYEVRIFMSTPDCDRLVEHLREYLQQLPWPGKYQVLKRYGEYVDEEAREEYVEL